MSAALLQAVPLVPMRLGAATLVFTAVACLLLAARRRLRILLGAETMYALWLAVPAGVGLCGWPAHSVVVALSAATPVPPATAWVAAVSIRPTFDWTTPLALAWAVGTIGCASLFVLHQRALWRMLGPLRRIGDDTWTSTRRDHGPLLAGLPRPRIVLPADFTERYTPAEQDAILAHERIHRRRGDLWWNALALGLHCLFWFHPLAARVRHACLADQELACDSAVLRAGRHTPRTYANALLKTHAGIGPALACAVRADAPLKERILNLQRAAASRRLRLAAFLLLAGLGATGARLAWAVTSDVIHVEPAAAGVATLVKPLVASIDFSIDEGASRHDTRLTHGRMRVDAVRSDGGRDCAAELVPRLQRNGIVDVHMQLTCDGAIVAAPRVLTPLGQAATIVVGATPSGAGPDAPRTPGMRLTVRFDDT